MQSSSLLCSSNSFSISPTTLLISSRFNSPPVRTTGSAHPLPNTVSSSTTQSYQQQHHHAALSVVRNTATAEIFETSESEEAFVEVGYISSIHGLQGELRVKPNTDFPELRLSEPGRRWLKQEVLGKQQIHEVELIEGRGHPGQKSWILTFEGIETVNQAKQLVGSSILVREDDRPELKEDEFYTRDLVGMRVVLKETGEQVGFVANVFDSGGNDLLQVRLDHESDETSDGSVEADTEAGASGRLVWVPFVEAIVPIVDMDRREMHITPPKGLLELNIRTDERSKKERRQLQWKERKKFQRRMISAKKKLVEMGQQHVFHGLRYGEKPQRSLLAEEIVGVNSKLFQHALLNIEKPPKRWDLSEFMSDKSAKLKKNILKISKKSIALCESESDKKLASNLKMYESGLRLLRTGKVATVLVLSGIKFQETTLIDSERSECFANDLEIFFSDDQNFIKLEDRASVPLLIICPTNVVESTENLFSEYENFSFDPEKTWFLEEEMLPIVSSSTEEEHKHKILMKSPWEMLKSPVGSGGFISLLSSNGVLDKLTEMGVEYFEICSIDRNNLSERATFIGLVSLREADAGIQCYNGGTSSGDSEENLDIIFSMESVKKMTEQLSKFPFNPIATTRSHSMMIDKEWVDVTSTEPNSYELRSSIYGFLNNLPAAKICVMQVTD